MWGLPAACRAHLGAGQQGEREVVLQVVGARGDPGGHGQPEHAPRAAMRGVEADGLVAAGVARLGGGGRDLLGPLLGSERGRGKGRDGAHGGGPLRAGKGTVVDAGRILDRAA